MTWCGAASTAFGAHINLFWQLSRDGNLHGMGLSYTTRTSPTPSSKAPLSLDDTVIGRGNADGQCQRVGIHALAGTADSSLLQKNSLEGSLLNCPSGPYNDLVGGGTELTD